MTSAKVAVNLGAASKPWVLVAGGFHRKGGMDKANAALATYLADRGHPLHLVAHEVESSLASRPGVKVYPVAKPAGSYFLGEWMLAERGKRVARAVSATLPATRVIVNGGNCNWPDVNWVHSVHHAWPLRDDFAPAWFRIKGRIDKSLARHHERIVIPAARLVIANSEKTRRDLTVLLGIPEGKIFTRYLGCEPGLQPASSQERRAARERWGLKAERPVAIFVGALGYDINKGFDTLCAAWKRLCARPEWDVDLVAAGGGRGFARWKELVGRAGLAERVTMVGFSERVPELLAAGDLLVSPVRYEAYGLNAHEALARGVPALISGSAGIAERYPDNLSDLILRDPEDVDQLVERLLGWRAKMNEYVRRTESFGERLRTRTWEDMACDIVELIEAHPDRDGLKS
jgi:glycosyltransferase involved in cell wall biosynthesis